MAPFLSEAQRKFMHAKHPKIAKKWEAETPLKPLPKYVKGSKSDPMEMLKRAMRGVAKL